MKRTIMILLGCAALLAGGCGSKEKSTGPDPDEVTSIKIMSMPGGEGIVVGDIDIVKDDTLELHAAGFNEDGEYVKDVMAVWTVTNTEATIGILVDSAGYSARLAATAFGKGSIRATTDDGETDVTGTITSRPGAPETVRSYMGNNTVSISWSPSPSSGIDGYFVYVVTASAPAGSTVHNRVDTTFSLTMITSGTPYNVYVVAYKTVTPMLPAYLSLPSSVLHVAARPYYAVTDTMYAFSSPGTLSANSSFGWADDGTGAAFPTGAAYKDTMDFFINFIDGTDIYLLSPDGHLIGWQSNVRTWFYEMGQYAFDDAAVGRAPDFSEATWTRAQKIRAGFVYAVKTAEGNFVKLRISELNAAAAVPYFLFEYGFQTAAGVTLFKK